MKLSWKILPLTFPMVTSHNSSTLLTCRVSWKGNYITKIYDVYNLFSHAKKVVHEGVEGNILKDILHWLLIKQKVLSSCTAKSSAFSLVIWEKIPLAFEHRIHHLMIDFLFTFFCGKIIAFVIFTVLIYIGLITEVAIILMPQLRQEAVFTLFPSHWQLLSKILLIDAQDHCINNRANFTVLALL